MKGTGMSHYNRGLMVFIACFGLLDASSFAQEAGLDPATVQASGISAKQLMPSLGLTAETLAAAGIVADDVVNMLYRFEAVGDLLARLFRETNAVDRALQDLAAHEASPATPENESQWRATWEYLQEQVQGTKSAARSTKNLLLSIALADLEADQQQRLVSIVRSLRYSVPMSFRVLELTETQWEAVELAVTAELHERENPDASELFCTPEQKALLLGIREQAEVITADANMGGLSNDLSVVLNGT